MDEKEFLEIQNLKEEIHYRRLNYRLEFGKACLQVALVSAAVIGVLVKLKGL